MMYLSDDLWRRSAVKAILPHWNAIIDLHVVPSSTTGSELPKFPCRGDGSDEVGEARRSMEIWSAHRVNFVHALE